MIIMGFASILLVTMLGIVSYHLTNSTSEALSAGVDDVLATVNIELTTAHVIGEGYRTTFTLPQRIQGLAYTIQLQSVANESVVNITAGSAYADRRVPPCTGTIAPGLNTITVTTSIVTCTPGTS